jgi:hypothetical protein
MLSMARLSVGFEIAWFFILWITMQRVKMQRTLSINWGTVANGELGGLGGIK